MSITRRAVLGGTAAAVASPALVRPAAAQAVTLKLHHFLPAVSNVHNKLLLPWAKKLADETKGALKVDVAPGMSLGGKLPELYDQARDGVVDMIWTLPGATAGRFPSTEVFELPFVAARRGVVNARAAQEFADQHLGAETKEVQLLSYWCHDHGLIHASRQIKTMDDLKGLKLRSPTRLAGEALTALGAAGIGMPITQVPESLAQKVIDGCVVPWEVVPAIKVHELVKFHTEIPGSPTLYTASFVLTMNKAKYAGLPAELKKVLDANSGQVFAGMAGKMWDDAGAAVHDMVKAKGNTISSIAEDEKGRWIKATEPVIAKWIDQVKAKGLDGAKLIAAAKALVAKHDKA
ncbi:MAG TPA: TRAP transporter substrate-binding protein [Hyphomicrobiaceae bacterium]|nr:TRAP transporter substrate-binding protein [Hyphomicrobiaceae bacterium]